MENFFLKETLLLPFLEKLRGFGELHGPTVSRLGVTCFAPLRDLTTLQLEYSRTQIPPKKYLLHFRDEVLRFRDGRYDTGMDEGPDVILFALHPCDLDGIAYLDLVFLGERPDALYEQRRQRLTLIGVSCDPDDFCFCSGNREEAPCDLFLARREGGYLLSSRSEKGERIVSAARDLLVPATGDTPKASLPVPIQPQRPEQRFSDHPLWQEFATRCVSCGACSVCCPTCYCFDIREYPQLAGEGIRLREWDNCLFVTHGEVAGANFRPTRLDRLRFRFLHKYCGFTPLEGMTSCVGCGRCRSVCPVDIDLRELLESRRKEALP